MKRTLFFLGVFSLLWALGFSFFIQHMNSFITGDEPYCEAVVVFTGKGRRIHSGYELFRHSQARGFLVSGVEEGLEFEDLEVPTHLPDGVDSSVTLGYEAYNTHTNALETALWVRKHNFKSICLVTGLYHMPRSFLELRAFLPQTEIHAHSVMPPKPLWKAPKQLFYMLSEYHKFCFTYLIQWCVA